ncbi:MAG: hypothetical protein AB7D16_10575 [Eubacteriaceae bacterium]
MKKFSSKILISLLLCAFLVFSSSTMIMASSQDLTTSSIKIEKVDNNSLAENLRSYYENLPSSVEIDENALNALLEELETTESVTSNSMFATQSTNSHISVYRSGSNVVVTMDRQGFDIISSIVSIGGGATAIGGAICAAAGAPITGAVLGAIGGYMMIHIGTLQLQFSLGYSRAVAVIPV